MEIKIEHIIWAIIRASSEAVKTNDQDAGEKAGLKALSDCLQYGYDEDPKALEMSRIIDPYGAFAKAVAEHANQSHLSKNSREQ